VNSRSSSWRQLQPQQQHQEGMFRSRLPTQLLLVRLRMQMACRLFQLLTSW
jgi:hypothetical protein